MWSVSTVLRHLLVAKGTEKPMGVYLKNGESILDAALDLMDILQPLSIAILGESNGLKEGKVGLGR